MGKITVLSSLILLPVGLVAQGLQRFEWKDFLGHDNYRSSFNLPRVYASSAINVNFDRGIIETARGNSAFAPMAGGGIVESLYGFRFSRGGQLMLSFGRQTNQGWRVFDPDGGADYATYQIGTASFTASGTQVALNTVTSGEPENWQTHLRVGDFIKRTQDPDSCYAEISAITSSRTLTLSSNYCSGPAAGIFYRYKVRKDSSITSGFFNVGAAILNDYVVLVSSSSDLPAQVFDGSLLETTNDTVGATNDCGLGGGFCPSLFANNSIPACTVVTSHKNRIFCANNFTSPDGLYWSPVNNPSTTWNSAATEQVGEDDGMGGIVSLISYKNVLFAFKQYQKIYAIFGDFSTSVGAPDSIREVPISESVGRIAKRTPILYRSLIWFLSERGLYIFDGSSVKLYNKNFQTEIESATSLFAEGEQDRIFTGVFNNKLYINLGAEVLVLDDQDRTYKLSAADTGYGGGFANFNNLFYGGLHDGATVVRVEAPVFSVYNDATGSTDMASMTYISNSESMGLPEVQKSFEKFYIAYEEMPVVTSSNTIFFDYTIDDSTYTVPVTTITTSGGRPGRLNIQDVNVGRIGNSVKWRLRSNQPAALNRIYRVIVTFRSLAIR